MDFRYCSGPLCKREVVAKGLCAAHYKQQRRNGVLSVIEEIKTEEDRFWLNIEKKNFDIENVSGPCWIWKGPIDKGYGRLYHNNKAYQAHRWSYEQHKHIYLTKKDTLDHKCRNTLCCNPEHLEKVSLIENIERQHLYHALVSENERLREFVIKLGYDPDTLEKL